MTGKKGIVFVNTGTPDHLTFKGVQDYLHRFLMDEDIITLPKIFRYLLVYKIIVPKRTQKVLDKYLSIAPAGTSPLKKISKNFERFMQREFPNDVIKVAMRYSEPSISQVVKELQSTHQVKDIYCIPLYPQFSRATTLSVYKEFKKATNRFTPMPAFFNDPLFIQSWIDRIKPYIISQRPDLILFSYHGLPLKFLKQTTYLKRETQKISPALPETQVNINYKQQCLLTTSLIIKTLKEEDLYKGHHVTTFQSRLGKSKWITPYTDEYLQENAKHFSKILVVSPSFIADGLETLEELGIDLIKKYPHNSIVLVPSLNTKKQWIHNFATIVHNFIQQGDTHDTNNSTTSKK